MVIREPLGSTLGYYSTYKRIKFIHINHWLDDASQRFVCAHELGHAILHPKINTPFLKKHTFFSINRYEQETNEFAVELLVSDQAVYEYDTLEKVALACGVPQELIYLKKYENFLPF
ncbi:MAG: ImmA/IrrE family metallo-endopeptidase [Eubacteriales bacterium]